MKEQMEKLSQDIVENFQQQMQQVGSQVHYVKLSLCRTEGEDGEAVPRHRGELPAADVAGGLAGSLHCVKLKQQMENLSPMTSWRPSSRRCNRWSHRLIA